MASWNCLDRHNSPSNVVSSSEHGCVPLPMCAGVQQRHLCVVPAAGAAWTVEDPASPHPVAGPCPQAVVAAAPFCPQRHMKVHAAPHLDASDAMCCRASRFPTSVTVDTSACCTSATSQEPCYNPGMCALQHSENMPIIHTYIHTYVHVCIVYFVYLYGEER